VGTTGQIDVQHPGDGIALLTLNRPEKLNALSFDLVEELHESLDQIAADNGCRVVVLSGSGRGFCAGLDLTSIGPSPVAQNTVGPRSGMRSQERIADLPTKLRRLRQPVIAAVNGPAYGGGFALALACDLRVASRSARFCSQFIKVGVGGCDIGMSYTLPRLIGAARAFELMLTAREVDADDALALGLVSEVVDEGLVVDRALELAALICSYSPFGVEMTKQVMWANLDAPSLESALHLENRTQILAGTGGDIMEAAAAFVEKRPPVWRPADIKES
jgi:enoyl-CoA hydratase/carnithine racemase